MNWRTTPTGMTIRFFAILAAVTFIATSRYSHTVFVTSMVVMVVVGVFFAVAVIGIRRHFVCHPMYPKPTEPEDEGWSNPKRRREAWPGWEGGDR